MIEVSSLVLMVFSEILLVSIFVALVLGVGILVKKRRDHGAAVTLIARIKEDESRRKGETAKIMEKQHGLQGDVLDKTVKKISREEKLFYQNMINLYLRRDADSLMNLNVDFEGAVEPYRTLDVSPGGATEGAGDAGSVEESEEMERLRQENERLSDELRITMDTMGRMLNEYSSMFAGGSGVELDKEKLMSVFKGEERSDEDATEESEISPEAEEASVPEPEAAMEEVAEESAALAGAEETPQPEDVISLHEDDIVDDDIVDLDDALGEMDGVQDEFDSLLEAAPEEEEGALPEVADADQDEIDQLLEMDSVNPAAEESVVAGKSGAEEDALADLDDVIMEEVEEDQAAREKE
jgi:hypothetical protein